MVSPMSLQQLSKVYGVIGVFLLYFTIDTWSVTQGGQIILATKGVDPHRVRASNERHFALLVLAAPSFDCGDYLRSAKGYDVA
jgi:hypothetical protein